MKALTTREWQFLKKHNITPTVDQCDEWTKRTDFKNRAEATKYAAALGFDLDDIFQRMQGEPDVISLEYEATYFLYNWFTKEELLTITDEEVTKALKDWKYFGGYRKWDGQNLYYAIEALQVYNGCRFFCIEEDGEVWNYEQDESGGKEIWRQL